MDEIKKIIFDTDIGEDPDDSVALAYMLEAEKRGLCRLIGITTCSKTTYGPACAGAICAYYGRPDIPIGQLRLDAEVSAENLDSFPGTYGMPVAKRFRGSPDYFSAPDALPTLKSLLERSEDKVTLIATGKLTNIRDLIADDEGNRLVSDKVSEIVIMGCDFAHMSDPSAVPHPEYNITGDIPAARFICEASPVPIVFSPYEMCDKVYTGSPLVERFGESHPTAFALIMNGCSKGRSSWDPSAALYGVEGECEVMKISPFGSVTFRGDGVSDFHEGNGKCRYLSAVGDGSLIGEKIDGYFRE